MTEFANVILATGQSTGALLHPTPGGHFKLQVKRGLKGRGLFAARDVQRNEIIATIAGYVAPEAVDGSECWRLAQNKFFVMRFSIDGFILFNYYWFSFFYFFHFESSIAFNKASFG